MSSLGGPSIVTSGLVLHLDAGNVKSYPGEETVNLTASGGLIGMSGITLTLISNDGVWKKYSMAGTFTGGTYPYIMYLTSVSFTGGLSYSTKCTIRTNVPSKFNYFGTQGINYVNQPMTNNGVRSSVTNSDGSFTVSNVGFIYTSTTTQNGYLLTNPIDGTVFSASTDFVWIKDLQTEQKSYTTPFVNGTRGTTVATGGGFADRSGNSNHGEVINGPTYNSLKRGSIVFDGVDDYVNFTSNIDFADSVAFSVETVISIPTFVQTLSRVHWLSGSGGNSMMMFRASDFYMWNEAGGINGLQISYTFNINTIYHVIVTRNVSNNVSLYVNGVFINSGSRSGQFKWSTMGRLGAGSTTYCSKFTSYFNRVYNRALSTTEVLQNYNATKSRFI